MTDHRYDRPEPGTSDWHEPLNENFRDLDSEVLEVVDTWDDLPGDAADVERSSNGQWPRYLVLEDRVQVRVAVDEGADGGDGVTREVVGGSGSADRPIPSQHVGALAADDLYTDGRVGDVFVRERGDQFVAFDGSGEIASGNRGAPVLQSAIDDAAPGDTVVVSGRYEVSGTDDELTVAKDLSLLGQDATITLTEERDLLAMNVTGGNAEAVPLATDAAAEATEFDVADTGPIEPGMVAVLTRDTVPYLPSGDVLGEATVVDEVGDGTVTTYDQVVFEYPTDDGASLRVYDPVTVEIEGFEFVGPGPTDGVTSGLQTIRTKDCAVRSCHFHDFGDYHSRVRECVGTRVADCVFEDGEGSGGDGYGVAVGGATHRTRIESNVFRNLRHNVSLVMPGPGVAKGVEFYDNYVAEGTGYMVDSHGGGLSLVAEGNTFYTDDSKVFGTSVYYGRFVDNTVYGGATLLFDRGPDVTNATYVVRDNDVFGEGGWGIRLRRSDPFARVVIQGNTWHDARTPGSLISVEEPVTDVLRIEDNYAASLSSHDNSWGIRVKADVPDHETWITGNRLADSERSLISVSGRAVGAVVADNHLAGYNHDEAESFAAIDLADPRDCVLKHNEFRPYDGYPGHHVVLGDGDGGDPGGNVLRDNHVIGPAGSGFSVAEGDDSTVALGNYGVGDDVRSTEPADPRPGTEYLDDGSNTASGEPGYRRYQDGEWIDLHAHGSG